MYLWITLKSKGDLGTSRSSRKREMSCVEEVWYSLVELPEIPNVVLYKDLLEKTEDIPMAEEFKV